MRDVVRELMNDRPLPVYNRDHALTGDYAGTRECHVSPDWLLTYLKSGDLQSGSLSLIRTGSHSELF
jgi:mRNA interferase YafQ